VRAARPGGGAAGSRGQAAVELLAAIPLLVLVGLLAWQLVGVLAAGMRAQERVREEALRALGASGRTITVAATARVPSILPGVEGMRVRARAAVRAP
jgi:hypothetical protein